MTLELSEIFTLSEGDTEAVALDYSDWLDEGELLTGTPTVVEVTTTDLTLASKRVNTTAFEHAHTGNQVAVGQAVQFTVTGGSSSSSPYSIKVTVSTDATPARTKEVIVKLNFT